MKVYPKLHIPLATGALLALVGCASTQPIRYAGLDSSPNLHPSVDDKSGRLPYEYLTGAEWRDYANVIIEPVAIYRGTDNQFDRMPDADKQILADFMHLQFAETLSNRFQIVSQPGPRTLRVVLTLTGAKATKQFLGTVTKFDLAGGPFNVVQSIRGKEGAMSGSVSYAVEIYDSRSTKLLDAYVAKQYPNAMNIKATFGGLGAARVGIRKGADELVARLTP